MVPFKLGIISQIEIYGIGNILVRMFIFQSLFFFFFFFFFSVGVIFNHGLQLLNFFVFDSKSMAFIGI